MHHKDQKDIQKESGQYSTLIPYLDDFLFCAPNTQNCNSLVRCFLNICKKLNVPVALEKTEWATNTIMFLGLVLNGKTFRLSIPNEKRLKALNWILKLSSQRKATIKQLEQLTGLLNFVCRAVVLGWAFTRWMYTKFSKLQEEKKLKKYHHINLDREFKEDCKVWKTFLEVPNENTAKKISRPFMDVWSERETSDTIQFYSDATANEVLGFGVIFGSSYLFKQWEPNFIKQWTPSIEFLELYALCVGVFTWQDKFVNRRVTLFCDNESCKYMVNDYTSGCKYCMVLIRKLVLKSLEKSFRIFVEHIQGGWTMILVIVWVVWNWINSMI